MRGDSKEAWTGIPAPLVPALRPWGIQMPQARSQALQNRHLGDRMQTPREPTEHLAHLPTPRRRCWKAFGHLPSSFNNFLKAPFRNQQEANPFIKLPPPFSCVATRLTYCYLKHLKNIWKRKQYKNDPETDSGLVILDHTLKNQERRVNCPLQGRGGSPLGHVTQHLSGSESDSFLWAQAV